MSRNWIFHIAKLWRVVNNAEMVRTPLMCYVRHVVTNLMWHACLLACPPVCSTLQMLRCHLVHIHRKGKVKAKKKVKKLPPIRINLSNCKYEVCECG